MGKKWAQACFKMLSNHMYLICMDKKDLALNNLQWLIWHKTNLNLRTIHLLAQSAGAVEYTTASLQRVKIPPSQNECPGYDTKQSDSEVLEILEL